MPTLRFRVGELTLTLFDGRTLEGWLRWHHKLLTGPVASAERLLSGSLEYSPADFVGAGMLPRHLPTMSPASPAH